MSEFQRKEKYGKTGEAFFDRYVGSLLRAPVFIRGEGLELLEGGDFFYVQEGKTATRKGFAEVKTCSDMSILKYGKRGKLTIPFEHSSYEAGTDQTRKEWKPGWGLQIIHWEKYNEYAKAKGYKTRAVKPEILAYLFCESPSLATVDPFVCIAFESFEETKKKIVASAKKHLHIDLENWDEIIKKKAITMEW